MRPSSCLSSSRYLLLLSLLLPACTPPAGTGPVTRTIPVAPICALLATDSMVSPVSNTPVISERTDTATGHGFVRLHSTTGQRGNTTPPGSRNDVFAFSEGWLHHPVMPVVFRAQVHPAPRPAPFNDFQASAWTISTQDATGRWSGPLFVGTANRGFREVDDRAAAIRTAPQLMPVGVASPQMFACAGARSDDDTVRTTSLFELRVPVPASNIRAATFIQDLLNGDDRFLPNAPGPLIGPSAPPMPRVSGPAGNHAQNGSVKCAMTQFEDDVATRELHMLTIDNGVLYHSMANDFGMATTESGSTFNRFRAVSPWGDVQQALGSSLGPVVAVTAVARPRMISVFFVTQGTDSRFRLFHTVRQSQGGTWRPVDDVLALTGGTPSTTQFDVAAGTCPLFGEEATGATGSVDELVYVMFDPDRKMTGGRIVSTPRQWTGSALNGIWSPLTDMTSLMSTTSDTTRNHRLETLWISTRPFTDNAMP